MPANMFFSTTADTNAPAPRPNGLRFGTALMAAAAVLLGSAAVAGAQSDDPSGFIHGTVKTKSGSTFKGLIRWDNEEAFWDDLFNSAKEETPYLEEFRRDGKRSKRQFEILGRKISVDWGNSYTGRVFVTRFGDIEKIEVLGSDEAYIHTKDGVRTHVEGSANDVSATLLIRDPGMGDIEVDWKKIDTIEFSAAPRAAKPWGYRMRGTVETDAGTFRGFVQWDKQECLSVDLIDGEADDINVKLEMGNIRSIERDGRSASDITLRDGRKLNVSGTNDVDDDNRGILVEDERFGRVEIPWMSFRKVTFDDAGSSGRNYDSYQPKGRMTGTVRTVDGESATGEIVLDLDEEYAWEMLDGDDDDISYSIPLGMVKSVSPRSGERADVVLRTGETLRLSDSQDVTDQNDGILVLSGDKKTYVAWEDLEILEYDG